MGAGRMPAQSMRDPGETGLAHRGSEHLSALRIRQQR